MSPPQERRCVLCGRVLRTVTGKIQLMDTARRIYTLHRRCHERWVRDFHMDFEALDPELAT